MENLSKLLTSLVRKVSVITIVLVLALIIYQFVGSLNNVVSQSNINQTSSQFSYKIDANNQQTVENIIPTLNLFTLVEPSQIPFELKDQTYWIKLDIENTSDSPLKLVLYADNNLLDIFNIFERTSSGDFAKRLKKPAALNGVFPHHPFELEASKQNIYLLQIRTDGPPNVPLLLKTQDDFNQHILYAQLVYGAFIGVIILMALYNLVLFLAVKDKVYLIYIGYLLLSFLVLSSITGFGQLIFDSTITKLVEDSLILLHFLLVIFLTTFTLYFLRFDLEKRLTYKIAISTCILLFILAIYCTTLPAVEQAKLFFATQPFVFILAIFMVSIKLKSNFRWAKFYFASWIPLLVGAAIQPAVLLNYLDYSFFTRNAFLFAIMIEITLMAFALAERMRRNEQDRLTNIAYHISSNLPRKSNIESYINQLCNNPNEEFKVVFIKPEHIEKVALYIDDEMNTELFKRLYKKLSSLFHFNDSIPAITENNEKICFVNNRSFAFILNSKHSTQSAEILVQSVQQVISENFYINDLQLPLTGIVGIAKYPDHGAKSHQLLNHAMLALAQAEESAQKWSEYTSQAKDQTNRLLKLTSDLKIAIEQNQLAIFHQPQIDLGTLRVCSSECLLRWQHPQEGFIPPNIFIPIAEDMGLINQLTFWVVNQALQQHYFLIDELNYNHMVSINISGKDISSKQFLSKVLDIIDESNVPADKIIFELTESASFTDNKLAMHVIEQLNDLGITISIDDFGTGYSTMSQISKLPFQELKVDREFVENIQADKKRMIITESTVKMAKGLGLEVVAEGINSEQDEDILRAFGCDIGQGYYYAKPMAFDEYQQWLASLNQGRVKQPLTGEFIPANK